MTEDQSPPEGQEVFDAEYVRKLRAENASYRTKAKENSDAAERLRALEDQEKSETQRLTDQLTAAQAQVAQSQADALRYRVGLAAGVPAEFIPRLQGSTEDELKADAEALSKHFSATRAPQSSNTPTVNLAPGATSEDDAKPVDSNEAFRRLLTNR